MGTGFLWVLHALVIILSCSLCVWALSRSRRILLPSFVLGFVVLDSIGLLFAPYVRNDFLPYISQGLATVDLLKLQHVYTRELTAHWIFLLVSSLFLLGETYSARKNGVVRMARISPRNRVFLILLKMFALFSYIRYFFLGPGLELLLSYKLFYESPSAAVADRNYVKEVLSLGQGAFLASITAYTILPVLALRSALNGKRSNFRFWTYCLLSAAYAVQTRQKWPIVAVILMYLSVYIISRYGISNIRKLPLRRIATVLVVGALILVIGTYHFNFGLSWSDSFISGVGRVFVVPCTAEAGYFYVFPDIFQFRGLSNSFSIDLMSKWSRSTSDVTIYDVADISLGSPSSLNASFLAVGWSGAGYLGVILVSVILLGLLWAADTFVCKLLLRDRLLVIALGIPSLGQLVSSSLVDFISSNAILVPLLLWLLSLPIVVIRNRNSMEANYERGKSL